MPQTENAYRVKSDALSRRHVGGNLPLAFTAWKATSTDTVRNSSENVTGRESLPTSWGSQPRPIELTPAPPLWGSPVPVAMCQAAPVSVAEVLTWPPPQPQSTQSSLLSP